MINVLIVDDDPMVAELNRRYLEQVDGFRWQGSVSTLQAAKQKLQENDPPIDLVLLDIYMQKDNGLDLLPVIRQMPNPIDVIMISSASDMPAIKKALRYGVVDYLIKPFQFARFREALTTYREEHQVLEQREELNQSELDNLIHRNNTRLASDKIKLPKGLTKLTLQAVWDWIKEGHKQSFSTEEMATEIGISRVSCRKYLVYMADIGVLDTDIFYGSVGRPVYLYKLVPSKIEVMDTLLR
ncbi:two-component system response regulator DcuR [Tolumonas lignilytica]|uniref:two-component system response regulator DcuR n=1 Tax=Tolumonas lignilytica TaxID=1283284 RepID=UPI000467B8FC|nr:two-component system response regulator DcuR [Tolumonas lignilytica]